MMTNKTKITFVVPEVLQNDLRQQIVKDGYGLRGKSKWVSEAITRLFAISSYPLLVSYNDEMSRFDKVETIVISYTLHKELDDAIITIRKDFPAMEGLKSRIIRTAILQRLLRQSTLTQVT